MTCKRILLKQYRQKPGHFWCVHPEPQWLKIRRYDKCKRHVPTGLLDYKPSAFSGGMLNVSD
jgi:hypothetical protein